jgi:hypothetical protein
MLCKIIPIIILVTLPVRTTIQRERNRVRQETIIITTHQQDHTTHQVIIVAVAQPDPPEEEDNINNNFTYVLTKINYIGFFMKKIQS